MKHLPSFTLIRSITVLILTFFFIFIGYKNAQAQCVPACTGDYFCSTAGGSSECCKCDCGASGGCNPNYNPACTGGPRTCCTPGTSNCNTIDNFGWCYPCPTQPPQATATPTGVPPSPTTPPATGNWLCINPGSTGSKCEMEVGLNCPNPDIIGAACFTTQEKCETGCTHMSPPPFISKTPLELLCTIVPGRFGINSAIGCFPADSTNDMLAFILRWALGVAGGIAFLLIIFSAFLIMTSGGNTEKVKSGRELLTAALTGLVVIIFSVFILDLVGIRILQIPGL